MTEWDHSRYACTTGKNEDLLFYNCRLMQFEFVSFLFKIWPWKFTKNHEILFFKQTSRINWIVFCTRRDSEKVVLVQSNPVICCWVMVSLSGFVCVGLLLAVAVGVISGVVIGFILLVVIFACRRRSQLLFTQRLNSVLITTTRQKVKSTLPREECCWSAYLPS